jgi:hypothetical protein
MLPVPDRTSHVVPRLKTDAAQLVADAVTPNR